MLNNLKRKLIAMLCFENQDDKNHLLFTIILYITGDLGQFF